MISDHTPFTLLKAALHARGFTYRKRQDDGSWEFQGALSAADGEHATVLSVDPRGLELPRIWVTLPASVPKVLAHIGADGYICYAGKGSLTPDIFDLPGQTLACLDRAAKVLDLSLRGEMMQDLEDEFFAFWSGTPCFIDIEREGPSNLTLLFADQNLIFVSNQPEATRVKLRAMGFNESPDRGAAAVKVQSSVNPHPLTKDWPPKTVSALLQWQGALDPAARRNMERRLLIAYGKGRKAGLCVVAAPKTQYAIYVTFPERNAGELKTLMAMRERLYTAAVAPMTVFRLDDVYVSERNAPGQPTLAGKRIALIGCGTIGGFLAELLVKAGAGLARGELLLIDPDIHAPQNVGRHRLGMNYVLQNKATALEKELSRGAPTAKMRGLPIPAEMVDLGQMDLIINATGEEALGHFLTKQWARRFVSTLTVWVDGAGVAARALLRDSPNHACSRCMSDLKRNPLFPAVVEQIPVELAGHGCESLYVPFPATASVHAACLAAEMVSDWSRGSSSPRLRTRVLRPGFTLGTSDVDVPRLNGCPACNS